MDFEKHVVFDARYILVDVATGLMVGADNVNSVAELLVSSQLREVDVLVPSELVEIRVYKNWDDKFVCSSTDSGATGASICLLANNIKV